MNLDAFVSDRQPSWQQLELAIAAAKGRPERLGPGGVRRFAELYRGATADLALARRKWPSDPLTRRLEDMIVRAHPLVYDTEPNKASLTEFFGRRYWRLVRTMPGLLGYSAALMLGAALLAMLWGLTDPAAAAGLVPEAFRGGPHGHGSLGLSPAQSAAFSTAIFTNNIKVTFMSFAGGIAAGILTSVLLVYNGVILGVLAGIALRSGLGERFFSLVLPHGLLELSCIVVASAAGLRLARALIRPGPRSRVASLTEEARPAVEIVLGTAPWLVLAGLIEGFVTPNGLSAAGAATVGVLLATAYWALVLRRGRDLPDRPATTAGRAPSP